MKKLLIITVALVAALGCSGKHDDSPLAALPVSAPPTVSALMITHVSGNDISMTWTVSDMTHVDHYEIYQVLESFTGLEYVPLATATSTSPPDFTLSFYAPGILFAVTAVSDENLESDPAFAVTP